jgi:hypothetical protein
MTSGQVVSEFLDFLGLVKSYFFKFFKKKKFKKIENFFFVLRRPRGSGDLPVCRIAC